jgi:hypothetical protein
VSRTDNLTAFMCRLSWNMEASNSCNPQGLFRPVQVLLFTPASMIRPMLRTHHLHASRTRRTNGQNLCTFYKVIIYRKWRSIGQKSTLYLTLSEYNRLLETSPVIRSICSVYSGGAWALATVRVCAFRFWAHYHPSGGIFSGDKGGQSFNLPTLTVA